MLRGFGDVGASVENIVDGLAANIADSPGVGHLDEMPGERDVQNVGDKTEDQTGNGRAAGVLAGKVGDVPDETGEAQHDQQAMKHEGHPNEDVGDIAGLDKDRAGNKHGGEDVENR